MLKRGVYLLSICAICLFIISVPLFAEDQAESLYADAKALQKQGKDVEAKAAYQQVIQQYPNSPAARGAELKLLGYEVRSLVVDGKDAAVESKIADAKKTYADHVGLTWFLYTVAEQYDDLKKYEKAVDLYGQILQQYPDSPVSRKVMLRLLRHKVQSLVAAGNDTAVQSEIAGAKKTFTDHADLPGFLYHVAKQYILLLVENFRFSNQLSMNVR
jgi:outer membrane protein assembly factor BamD (BamD/ComL family)